ncbi:hypothetical protein G9A89_013434 [Geosiphon pyriformis]|nr:hypothetical protein G9A89_013434 [Geosiphon pyriformis]
MDLSNSSNEVLVKETEKITGDNIKGIASSSLKGEESLDYKSAPNRDLTNGVSYSKNLCTEEKDISLPESKVSIELPVELELGNGKKEITGLDSGNDDRKREKAGVNLDGNSNQHGDPINSEIVVDQVEAASHTADGDTGISPSRLFKRGIEKGVITLPTKIDSDGLELELVLLSQIPKVRSEGSQCFSDTELSSSHYTFSSFWGPSSQAQESDIESLFRHESLSKGSAIFQSYVRQCAEEICEDQRIIIETVKSVDQYCTQISQAMVTSQLQAKVNLDQIVIVNSFMKQVEKTHKHVYDIFQILSKLEKLLPEDSQLGDKSANEQWPNIHDLYLKTKPKHAQHGGSFQFETKRLSLHQRRTYPSSVAVTFDTVLSSKHQDAPEFISNKTLGFSPEKSYGLMAIDPLAAAGTGVTAGSSIDSTASDRLKEIFTHRAQENIGEEQLSSSTWSLGLLPLHEGQKRLSSNRSIDNLLWSSASSASSFVASETSNKPLNNDGSLISTWSGHPSTASSHYLKPLATNSINNSKSPSMSLLTSMLRRSTSHSSSAASKEHKIKSINDNGRIGFSPRHSRSPSESSQISGYEDINVKSDKAGIQTDSSKKGNNKLVEEIQPRKHVNPQEKDSSHQNSIDETQSMTEGEVEKKESVGPILL